MTTTPTRHRLPDADAATIAASALALLDRKPTEAGQAAIEALALLHDIENRRILVLDDHGHPHVEVDAAGDVREVEIGPYLAGLAKTRPELFDQVVSGATTLNPFRSEHWSLTRQSLLRRSDPQAAARLEAEAAKVEGRDNPWTQAGFNLTQQALLNRTDPERAKQLRQEAGR